MRFFRLLGKLFDTLPKCDITDRIYLVAIFVYAHRRLPLRNSGLFNDYLYFLKSSSDLLDIFRQVTSDKVMVKDFVRARCGEGMTVGTSEVFSCIDQINVSLLAKPCVIKPAHSSGSVVFVKEDQDALTADDEAKLNAALASSPYESSRESNYRYLRPRLICEPMLPLGEQTKDYKFFCYMGRPRLVQVDSERHKDHRRNIYKANWTPLNIEYNFPIGEWESAPSHLGEMIEVAKTLSSPFNFVRVDFFVAGANFYVGELTHCPESAHGRFDSPSSEKLFSEILFSDVPLQ